MLSHDDITFFYSVVTFNCSIQHHDLNGPNWTTSPAPKINNKKKKSKRKRIEKWITRPPDA